MKMYCIKYVKFRQKHKGDICKGSHISVLICSEYKFDFRNKINESDFIYNGFVKELTKISMPI